MKSNSWNWLQKDFWMWINLYKHWINNCLGQYFPKLVHACSVSFTSLLGEGNGTPLQYSCLENPMDRGAWEAAVHGVAKSQTRLSDFTFFFKGCLGGASDKNPPANAGDIRDLGSIPGWWRSPGEGNGNPLQYSCLENPMDREAWQATVHGVTKSWAWLSDTTFSKSTLLL